MRARSDSRPKRCWVSPGSLGEQGVQLGPARVEGQRLDRRDRTPRQPPSLSVVGEDLVDVLDRRRICLGLWPVVDDGLGVPGHHLVGLDDRVVLPVAVVRQHEEHQGAILASPFQEGRQLHVHAEVRGEEIGADDENGPVRALDGGGDLVAPKRTGRDLPVGPGGDHPGAPQGREMDQQPILDRLALVRVADKQLERTLMVAVGAVLAGSGHGRGPWIPQFLRFVPAAQRVCNRTDAISVAVRSR